MSIFIIHICIFKNKTNTKLHFTLHHCKAFSTLSVQHILQSKSGMHLYPLYYTVSFQFSANYTYPPPPKAQKYLKIAKLNFINKCCCHNLHKGISVPSVTFSESLLKLYKLHEQTGWSNRCVSPYTFG